MEKKMETGLTLHLRGSVQNVVPVQNCSKQAAGFCDEGSGSKQEGLHELRILENSRSFFSQFTTKTLHLPSMKPNAHLGYPVAPSG